MKKIILTLCVLFTVLLSSGQINETSKLVKVDYPEVYEIIKTFSIDKWDDNHKMIAYEINKQVEAMITMLSLDLDSKLFQSSVIKWGLDGYRNKNLEILGDGVTPYSRLYVNWAMVLYEYEKQLDAKNSY